MRARTIQSQTVIRARILLLKAEGISVDHIADKVGMNRKSVMLCINKYLEGGVENALFDAPGRGRNAEITDDEKTWIINNRHSGKKILLVEDNELNHEIATALLEEIGISVESQLLP